MREIIYTSILWLAVLIGVIGALGFFLPLDQSAKGAGFLLAALIMYLLFELAKSINPKQKRKLKK